MSLRLIAVCGPTASGKSAVSVALAQRLNAEVLNFDASQTFIGADIGTAKITAAQMCGVRHHLLDLLGIDHKLQAGFFLKKAEAALEDLRIRNIQPLICVGTTMYLSLPWEGIAQTGEGDPDFRESLEEKSSQELYQSLQIADPERALELHPNDRMRIIRALEICHTSGKPASAVYAEQLRPKDRSALLMVLCWNREALAQRIEQRVAATLKAGLVGECRNLLQKFGPQAQIFSSIGYAETLKYLEDQIGETELSEEISLHSKQLAKRQMTFLRRFPAKHGFICYPAQIPESSDPSSRNSKKNQQLDFIVEKLSLVQLKDECNAYLASDCAAPVLKSLYIDADYLLQTIAVS